MPLTKEEFEEAVRAICPHCRSKMVLRFRDSTKEWVHEGNGKHAICWANGLRQSRFAEGTN